VQRGDTLGSIPAVDIVEQAAYNKGECLRMAGKHEEANTQFTAVVSAFPGTDAAKSAQDVIDRYEKMMGGNQ